MKKKLDDLHIDTRVLVINGAYDAEILKESFQLGDRMSATHLIITHMDEVSRCGKLWPFILKGGLTPLFFSCGQDISGDFTDKPIDFLVRKVFPSMVVN